MSDNLVRRVFIAGEEAAWIADKIVSYGEYGKDAARLLRLLSQVQAENESLKRDKAMLEARIIEMEGWNDISTIEWAGNLYKDNIATHKLMLEVEALRKGVGISYPSVNDDPLAYLKRVMPSVEQLNAVEKIRAAAELRSQPSKGE